MLTYSQLSQLRASTTTPELLYSSSEARDTIQIFVKICNTIAADVAVRVFHSPSGATYDETTAIVWDMILTPGDILELDHIFVTGTSERIAYRTDTANALNATVYGVTRYV